MFESCLRRGFCFRCYLSCFASVSVAWSSFLLPDSFFPVCFFGLCFGRRFALSLCRSILIAWDLSRVGLRSPWKVSSWSPSSFNFPASVLRSCHIGSNPIFFCWSRCEICFMDAAAWSFLTWSAVETNFLLVLKCWWESDFPYREIDLRFCTSVSSLTIVRAPSFYLPLEISFCCWKRSSWFAQVWFVTRKPERAVCLSSGPFVLQALFFFVCGLLQVRADIAFKLAFKLSD
jgi:hypothetical protein